MSSGPAGHGGGGRLAGRLIGLGVTGSIAAYKAVDLLRRLQDEGADVVVLLTPAGARFVGPLTFAALSHHPVESDVTALLPDGRIGHIVIADSVDALLVAPATANWLAMMAAGLSGDSLTAAALATSAPVVVAPAMDGDMYGHPATRENVRRLRDDFGYRIVEPESGPLASGQQGVGRLAEPARIIDAVVAAVGDRPIRAPDPEHRPPLAERPREADLAGRRIVVTAGGTREPIDAVRFIGNRSTGKMGAALAEAAIERGASVTLIAANVAVDLPSEADVRSVETTGQLRAAVLSALIEADGRPGLDALVMAAAVADFRPVIAADGKLVRGEAVTLELEPTPDILAEVARIAHGLDASGAATRAPLEPRPVLVGFAAEAGSVDRAPGKLARKQVDMVVANDVTEAGSGFGTDTNRVTIFGADGGRDDLPLLTKRDVADRILDRVVRRLAERDAGRLHARGVAAQTARANSEGQP
jgi:phosphopantothenoylcysteine decarboxylase/phosphopantothenate--cysteine ligase